MLHFHRYIDFSYRIIKEDHSVYLNINTNHSMYDNQYKKKEKMIRNTQHYMKRGLSK